MKIGLLGFSINDANKGCEALTYSFINILQKIYPDSNLEIKCFFCGGKFGKIVDYFTNINFSAPIVKFKDIKLSAVREMRDCDVIFDITSGDGFSDIYFKSLVLATTKVKRYVELLNIPLVLLPQTYGPFKDDKIEKLASKVIKKSKKVYSRDEMSSNYVYELTGIKPITVTDLAFSLPYSKKVLISDKVKVGVNVSGLLWNGGFTDKNQFGLKFSYARYIEQLIEILLKKGYEVHLIPHVIENDNDKLDGDVKVCKMLQKKYSEVIFAGEFKSPIEAKDYISAMDVFTGARMHSTIAAMSSGVPVVPFSYSRKFDGLYYDLHYNHLIHGREMDINTALEETIYKIENREFLKQQLNDSMKKVKSNLCIFEKSLNELLKTEMGLK